MAFFDGKNMDRLPRGLAPESVLKHRFGDWVSRPWLDRAAFGSLTWFFPLSRLWAAANMAGGDPDRFAAAVPFAGDDGPEGWLLDQALHGVRSAQRRYTRIQDEWERVYFGGSARAAGRLVEAELERRTAGRIWMATRGLMAPILSNDGIPPVRWQTPVPDALLAELAPMLTDPAAFYAPPDPLPAIECSHKVLGPEGLEYWLRFPSKDGETAWAKVYEPEEPADRLPTAILCHGLCVEQELWGTTAGIPHALIRQGVRVISPEAPWHGRRMRAGFYGGEPLIATAPRGAPDLFRAALSEIATLTGWARGQGSHSVAIGGTSLGALTTQLAATKARDWPSALQPDFLLLVTTSGSLRQVAVDGELGEAFGLDEALRKAGWTDELLQAMSPLTDPDDRPVMPPERIVMVLGREDSVTAFDEGRSLAERWKVPADNLYIRDQGHFSAAVGVIHDDAPLRQLHDMMMKAG
ncbi:MAG: hypothetical protein OEZ03_00200 [Alphaproteobacteria bacterium]|nr:hypothetical protein [Alphaproteobacteria bacterium]